MPASTSATGPLVRKPRPSVAPSAAMRAIVAPRSSVVVTPMATASVHQSVSSMSDIATRPKLRTRSVVPKASAP